MADIILTFLLLNTKQEIIVCKIMRYTMYNQVILKLERSDQLLFVIRGQSGVGKNHIIKAIG